MQLNGARLLFQNLFIVENIQAMLPTSMLAAVLYNAHNP